VILPLAPARRGAPVLALVLAIGCPGDDTGPDPGPEPVFPADYEAHYTEVRDCRGSGDHDLHNIRVLTDAAALAPYRDRTEPFPAGSVVLKVEYDFGDLACEADPVRWTVMQRLPAGTSPDTLDWLWQDVDAERRVVSEDRAGCIGCHAGCGVEPDGYAGTCAMP
jgi:hypothetical protein